MAIKKVNLRSSMQLFELKSGEKYVDLVGYITKKGTSLLATRMLYFRLLAKAVDSSNGVQMWFIKPEHGLTRADSIEKWLREDTRAYHMACSDLLNYCAASTLRSSIKLLVDVGLVEVDLYNRMHVRYPVDGKMLPLAYASNAIKAKLRKPTSLDKPDENSVESETERFSPVPVVNNMDEVGDFSDNYWENEEESK